MIPKNTNATALPQVAEMHPQNNMPDQQPIARIPSDNDPAPIEVVQPQSIRSAKGTHPPLWLKKTV